MEIAELESSPPAAYNDTDHQSNQVLLLLLNRRRTPCPRDLEQTLVRALFAFTPHYSRESHCSYRSLVLVSQVR